MSTSTAATTTTAPGTSPEEAAAAPLEENTATFQLKQALRKDIRRKLKTISQETLREQSKQVWDRLFAMPEYQNATSVGLFLSMPKGEIDTDPLLVDCFIQKKTIYIPEVGQNFESYDMDLVKVMVPLEEDETNNGDVLFHHRWPKNKWGIPEPPDDMPREPAQQGDMDVLIVPGLAFDRNGGRCGQGKGYYDRFITKIRQDHGKKDNKGRAVMTKPVLIGVGIQANFVESVPLSMNDFMMDRVLLPNETMTFEREYS